MKPHRWMKAPVTPAGACKHCEVPTVRVRGLTPVTRTEKMGGNATFQICPRCDGIAAGPRLTA